MRRRIKSFDIIIIAPTGGRGFCIHIIKTEAVFIQPPYFYDLISKLFEILKRVNIVCSGFFGHCTVALILNKSDFNLKLLN